MEGVFNLFGQGCNMAARSSLHFLAPVDQALELYILLNTLQRA